MFRRSLTNDPKTRELYRAWTLEYEDGLRTYGQEFRAVDKGRRGTRNND